MLAKIPWFHPCFFAPIQGVWPILFPKVVIFVGHRLFFECSFWQMMMPSGKLTWPSKITIFHGKTHYKWQFSISMSNYQRINGTKIPFLPQIGKFSLPAQVGYWPYFMGSIIILHRVPPNSTILVRFAILFAHPHFQARPQIIFVASYVLSTISLHFFQGEIPWNNMSITHPMCSTDIPHEHPNLWRLKSRNYLIHYSHERFMISTSLVWTISQSHSYLFCLTSTINSTINHSMNHR